MSRRLILGPTTALAEGPEGFVAYHPPTRRIHRLNPTASLLISLCDGTRDRDQIEEASAAVLDRSTASAWIDLALHDGLIAHESGPIPHTTAAEFAELADELRSDGAVEAAFICRSRAVELAPDDLDIAYGLAELAHILGRRDVARTMYERWFEAHPDDAEVAHLLISLRDQPPPPRASDEAIKHLYKRFSSNYDESMVDDLEYRAPDLLENAVDAAVEGRDDLAILDIGCGTGLSGLRLRPRATSLTGIDLSPEMVARARSRAIYDRLETAEITAWLADDDGTRFDLITACDCLIYFGDLAQVLAPARKRLRSKGLMVLTVERGDHAPFALTDNGRYTHHRTHIEQAAKKSGFRVSWIDEEVLRYEYGEEVVGLVATLRADGADPAEPEASRLRAGSLLQGGDAIGAALR